MRLFALLAACPLFAFALGAGCGTPRPAASDSLPRPSGAPGDAHPDTSMTPDRIALGDSVLPAIPAPQPANLVAEADLELGGPAAFETTDVRWLSILRATTPQQRATAERMGASGAYLADSARVLRLRPAPGRPATAAFPRPAPVGAPFQGEMLVRVEGEGPAPTLRFEHAAPSECVGGRCRPSALAVEFLDDDGGGYDRARLLLGDGRGPWSEQPAVALPALDWRGLAHRIGLVVEPNRLSVTLDGVAVIEPEHGVVGPPAAPALRAEAVGGTPTASLLILEWTFAAEGE